MDNIQFTPISDRIASGLGQEVTVSKVWVSLSSHPTSAFSVLTFGEEGREGQRFPGNMFSSFNKHASSFHTDEGMFKVIKIILLIKNISSTFSKYSADHNRIFNTFTDSDHEKPQKCLSFPWLQATFFPKEVAMHKPGTFSTLLHSYNFLLQGLNSIETRAQGFQVHVLCSSIHTYVFIDIEFLKNFYDIILGKLAVSPTSVYCTISL